MSRLRDVNTVAFRKKLSFGAGNVQNDFAAAMSLSYWLIYLNQVIELDSGFAGIALLLGQISDAICTPLIGYKSDECRCFKIGKRKSWHLFGAIVVTIIYPFLFIDIIVSSEDSNWIKFIYFATFEIILNIGYASVQVNHLALIPELTSEDTERVALTSYRYAFTVVSNMTVYGIAWAIFDFIKSGENTDQLGPSDAYKFRTLVLILVGIGIITNIIFYIGVDESLQNTYAVTDPTDFHAPKTHMKWKQWFKETQFYQVAVIYMCSRLIVNISQIYLPFYLLETIHLNKISITIMPFIAYISGIVPSILMRVINRKCGRKLTFLIGILLTLAGCLTFYFLKDGSKFVYMSVVINGMGSATVLITSISMIADLINSNTESGAFVYGAMGFTEKIATGVVIVLIQQMNPCGARCCSHCKTFFRNVLTFVLGGVTLMAAVVLATLARVEIGFRTRQDNIKPLKQMSAIAKPGTSNDLAPPSVTKDTERQIVVYDNAVKF